MHNPNISRRVLAAVLALAPVASLPALAGAAPVAAMSEALARAIERHRTAQAAVAAHPGPKDLPEQLLDAEFDARADLAETPAANTDELLVKLRYLLELEQRAWSRGMIGGEFNLSEKFASVMLALDLHLNP